MELLKEVRQIQDTDLKWFALSKTLEEVSLEMARFKEEYFIQYFNSAERFLRRPEVITDLPV